MDFDFDEIKQILAMVKEHELAEFELEHQGFKIRIKKDGGHPVVAIAPPLAAPAPHQAVAALPAAPVAAAAASAPVISAALMIAGTLR